jgi:hypothetical protein
MLLNKRLLELVTTPTGRLSTSDTTLVGAFLISSLVLMFRAWFGEMTDVEFGAYLGAWVAQNQISKQASIKRDSLMRGKSEND